MPLQDVIEEALAEGRRARRCRRATSWSPTYPPEPLVVTADRQRLKQTALIAIDNAIKYSHPGSPVEVELRAEDRQAVLQVRNRGEAIPPEDLPYVFERFYRGRHGQADRRQRPRPVDRQVDRREARRHDRDRQPARRR